MQLPTRIALSIILVSVIAFGGTSIGADAADLNDPIRLLEQTCDDNVHSGKVDEALKQLQQAIGLARQNAKDKNRLAHLLLKRTQLTVSHSPEKIWTKELLRLVDERDFINQCAINEPELLIDIDDLYDSVRLRAAQNPT